MFGFVVRPSTTLPGSENWQPLTEASWLAKGKNTGVYASSENIMPMPINRTVCTIDPCGALFFCLFLPRCQLLQMLRIQAIAHIPIHYVAWYANVGFIQVSSAHVARGLKSRLSSAGNYQVMSSILYHNTLLMNTYNRWDEHSDTTPDFMMLNVFKTTTIGCRFRSSGTASMIRCQNQIHFWTQLSLGIILI